MFGMAPKTNVNLAMGLPRLLGREGERTIIAPPPGLEAFGPLAATAADRSEKANDTPDMVLDAAPRFAQEEGRVARTCVAEMNEFVYAPFTDSDLPFGHTWSDASTAVPVDTVPSLESALEMLEEGTPQIVATPTKTLQEDDLTSGCYVPGSVLLREANPNWAAYSHTLSSPLSPGSPVSTVTPTVSEKQPLQLDGNLDDPFMCVVTTGGLPQGSLGTLSIGSMLHRQGLCKPCDFTRRDGCRAGVDCPFCHLCTTEDAKRKKKEKRKLIRQMRK